MDTVYSRTGENSGKNDQSGYEHHPITKPEGVIGDCLAPAHIASAFYSGHKYAREFDEPDRGDVPFKRERDTLET